MPALSDVRNALSAETDELANAWSRCRDSWRDKRAILFEERVLHVVKRSSVRLLSAIESFDSLLERIRKDVAEMRLEDLRHWEPELVLRQNIAAEEWLEAGGRDKQAFALAFGQFGNWAFGAT